ncbi:MAG: dihydrolipoyl dehydrogenase [Alphaproteobacteria bacterium]|nr:dihydrolipoyl dehydrogenase [Alphaproteobacteria bacterium]
MAERKFDLVVVGGGPGGYVSAIRAAQLGMKVAVVEANHLGGICLNWGCIPTKALLRTSEIYHYMQNAEAYGLKVDNVAFDIKKVVERSRVVAGQLNQGVGYLLKKNGVEFIDGWGKLVGGKAGYQGLTVTKNGKKVAEVIAKNILLATGARARELPGMEADGKQIWSYREAMVPEEFPKSLLVVGSGAIGIEFASFYRTLGAEVTVVELADRILPIEDEEVSGLAAKAFEDQGMVLITGASVKALEKQSDKVTAALEKDGKVRNIEVERVIMAVGIVGNVENIGLEGTKVKVENSHIVIDEWGQTAEPGVWAIGDVAGPPWLAHKASHEGIIAVERIAGGTDINPLDTSRIPSCIYCRPQVASIGMTEAAAKESGRKVKVGRFPFQGNGKAIAMGEPEGLIKTIFDAGTGELLGAHMIGAEGTELIQGYGIAKTLETTEHELVESVFPHPTLSEMMHESVLDACGRTIHF